MNITKIAATAALLAAGLAVAFAASTRADNGSPAAGHVGICHHTGNSVAHEWIYTEPDASGVFSGHGKDSHQDEEDIIPAFQFTDAQGAVHVFAGLNLTTTYGASLEKEDGGGLYTGAQILAARCSTPATTTTSTGTTTGTTTVGTTTVGTTTTAPSTTVTVPGSTTTVTAPGQTTTVSSPASTTTVASPTATVTSPATTTTVAGPTKTVTTTTTSKPRPPKPPAARKTIHRPKPKPHSRPKPKPKPKPPIHLAHTA